jgi:hypothetical protein
MDQGANLDIKGQGGLTGQPYAEWPQGGAGLIGANLRLSKKANDGWTPCRGQPQGHAELALAWERR